MLTRMTVSYAQKHSRMQSIHGRCVLLKEAEDVAQTYNLTERRLAFTGSISSELACMETKYRWPELPLVSALPIGVLCVDHVPSPRCFLAVHPGVAALQIGRHLA
jgi:hypothetical protein